MKMLTLIALIATSCGLAHAATVNNMTLKNQFGETSINQIVSVSAAGKVIIGTPVVYECGVSVGGAATEALTCTGLATTDTILAVTQRVQGANAVAVSGYASLVANGLTVRWTANPGAGAVVRVTVQK
jgi:hypothetical protein